MPSMSSTQATQQPTTSRRDVEQEPLVSVVIPCLNEAANIEKCVGVALAALDGRGPPR